MFCKFCGKQIDNDAVFCSYCGNNLQQGSRDAEIQAALEWKQAQKDYKEQMNQRIAQQQAEAERASGRNARPRPNLDGLKDNTRFCQFCGTKIDGECAFCPACGRSLSGNMAHGYQSQAQGMYYTAPKKPLYKRWWFWLLLIVITLAVALTGIGYIASMNPASVQSTEPVNPRDSFTPPPAKILPSSGALGDYHVSINDFEIVEDYNGDAAILIRYTFTNNSEEKANGLTALASYAYQNGVQLETAMIFDSKVHDSSNNMKDIKPGASIDLESAYLLTSETAPVEFEMVAAFSLDDDRIGKTFSLAEDGTTELARAPEGEEVYYVGDYDVSIVSHDIVKDYDGNDAILLTIGFTNYSNKTASYLGEISLDLFQDGIELETAFLSSDVERDSWSSMRNVRPGAGIAVQVGYVLSSKTAPIEIEIEEFFGHSDQKIETVINIAE